MTDAHEHTQPADTAAPPPVRFGHRLRQRWQRSLRFRLLAMGLMPLLVAFPLVLVVLVAVGGDRSHALLMSNLGTTLSGAATYLQQLRTATGVRVGQLARSERLMQRLRGHADGRELDLALRAAAESSGLDFLLVALPDGHIVGSSSGRSRGQRLPDSFVVRQARLGVANVAYERFNAAQVLLFAPELADRLHGTAGSADAASHAQALLIHAGAHFPLAVDLPDAVLLGGVLVNRNTALIEHLREVVFPVGSLPDDVEGLASVQIGDQVVAASRAHMLQGRTAPPTAPAAALQAVLQRSETWLGRAEFGDATHAAGYEPLLDGEGRAVALLSTAFPEAPYQRVTLLLLGMIAALLALTMLALSLAFLHSGRELAQRLHAIGDTMTAVREGRRQARMGPPARDDELGRLSRHFDELLDTIAAQDLAQRAAQQTLADEASRRRALFEHERDGVIILQADGSVFEANPRGAAMLGCTPTQLLRSRVGDWTTPQGAAALEALVQQVGPEGAFLETALRRADGSTYAAEVALSRAAWGEQTFVLLLMRDISGRKAVEAELERYRQELERRVEQRTQELHDRNEQLDAVFALSPDGFVSFDRQRRVAFVNRAFTAMTGLTARELIGLGEFDLSTRLALHSAEESPFPGVALMREARRAGDEREPRTLFELRLPRRRVLQVGLRLAEADHVSQVLYLRDVTHETEVDRMKSEFLTTAAHELRTPMTSIYGFANLLRMRDVGPERRHEVLGTIATQSELMIGILNQLLDLARIEARQGQDFERRRLPLKEVVDITVAGFGVPAGREPPWIGAFDAAWDVDADRSKLHQALLNVLSNAYKYSPDGGAVELHPRHERRDGRARVGIAVRDHGIGMTAEQLSHMCERFYRADASGNIPGTGLGMAIVGDIVKLHGGTLEFASRPGDGTTVTLWLPLAEAETPVPELAEAV